MRIADSGQLFPIYVFEKKKKKRKFAFNKVNLTSNHYRMV